METQTKNIVSQRKPGLIRTFFKKLGSRIYRLFEPEEVEVTFKEVEGKKISYTYTIVEHKQVA